MKLIEIPNQQMFFKTIYMFVVSCTEAWVGYVLTHELHQLINQVCMINIWIKTVIPTFNLFVKLAK